jgi:hypothetical protein
MIPRRLPRVKEKALDFFDPGSGRGSETKKRPQKTFTESRAEIDVYRQKYILLAKRPVL